MELTNCFSLCCTLSAVVRFSCAAVLSLFERNLLDYPKKKKNYKTDKITRPMEANENFSRLVIQM